MMQRTQRSAAARGRAQSRDPGYLQQILERCLADRSGRSATRRWRRSSTTWTRERSKSSLDTRRSGGAGSRPAAAAPRPPSLLGVGGACWRDDASGGAGGVRAAIATRPVLISDFENRTGEPVFDGTLEPAFGLALEGASFISSYNRASAQKVAAQLKPGAAAG